MYRSSLTTSTLAALGAVIGSVTLMAAAPLIMRTYKFTPLAYPGALNTQASGINGDGEIVGWWLDANGAFHGFVLSGGEYESFDVPGALGTYASDINDSGTIAGTYDALTADGVCCESHGFLRSPDGRFLTIDYPGAASDIPVGWLFGINNAGHVVGGYNEWVNNSSRGIHSFMFDGTTFTPIDFPTPVERVHIPVTFASGINDAGEIVGGYNGDDVFQTRHGFVLRNGEYKTFDLPTEDFFSFTDLFDINNRGEIVGETFACPSSSFLYSAKRGFTCITGTPISKPKVIPYLGFALNDRGQIVGLAGRVEPSDGSVMSYLATPPPARR